ncbi:sigma-70 family RNA polymerase sigma factor [Pigmentiphaga soli]|uniref:sigma-70 family RNA polymerase sigma factor n=1 Tax=Pigmentiphaga soli TaxID=1007095 RepID=UPI0031EE0AD7
MSIPGYRCPSSIESLYAAHHSWLTGWLRRRLGSAADAADLAHDAFLRLILKPAPRGFQTPGEARAYLRAVGNSLCVDLWRRREVEQAWLEALAAGPERRWPSAEERAIVVETLMEIGGVLGRLPQKAAAAFIMAQIDGTPYRDIAGELGVSERMVKKYIAQAMLQCALLVARSKR